MYSLYKQSLQRTSNSIYMKKILLPICIIVFLINYASAQSYKYVYYLDENLVSVEKSNASLIGKGLNDSTLFLVDCFDKITGKLSVSAHFPDSSLSRFEGRYREYYTSGQTKQEGNYENGEQQGEWFLWDSTGLKTLSVLLDKGKQISATQYHYYKGNLSSKRVQDSNGEEIMFVMYDKKGNEIKDDKIFEKADVKPVFQEDRITFQRYAIENTDTQVPYSKGASHGRYLVYINFVVEKNGQVTNVKSQSLEGYGMEDEAIRVIKNSPLWKPALQNGNPVRFQMKEIVPFVVNR